MFSPFRKKEQNSTPTDTQGYPPQMGAAPPYGTPQGQAPYQPPYNAPYAPYTPNPYPPSCPPGAYPVPPPADAQPPDQAPPQGQAAPQYAPPYAPSYAPPPYGAPPPSGNPNAGGTAAPYAKNQFKIALRRLILIAFALVLVFWVVMTACGYRYRSYDQGGMTARIYGKFSDDGYSDSKHHYSDGTRAKWDKKAQAWEFSDGAVFVGTLREGFFVTGTLTTADYVYSGTFANGNLPNGQGNIVYADGTRYEGSFLDGVFHGHGRLTYADGRSFVGEFAHGKREGYGTLFDAAGAVLQEGLYKADCFVVIAV